MKKTITILMLLMLLQIAVSAQTSTIHYEYDATGNRYNRWIEYLPIAPPQNNSAANNPTIAEDIKSIIAAVNTNGLTVITEGDIKVFPNPVQEKLNIQFKGSATAEGCSLQLYDGAGKLLYSTESMQNLTEVNMQAAKAGAYFLVVLDKEGKRLYWKLVKQ